MHTKFYFHIFDLLFLLPTQVSVAAAIRAVNTSDYSGLGVGSLSGYTFSYASFSSSHVNLAILLESFLTLQGVLYLFDYVYRTLQTVKLIATFWGKGVVSLPVTDLRPKKPEIGTKWFKYISYFLKLWPFFSLQILLIAIFVVVVVWGVAGENAYLSDSVVLCSGGTKSCIHLLQHTSQCYCHCSQSSFLPGVPNLAVFVPEYHSYVGTCVHHTANNTYLSRNLDSLAFNYASSDGNSAVARGISRYNALSSEYCSANAAGSLQVYTTLLNQLYSHNQTLAVSVVFCCAGIYRTSCAYLSSDDSTHSALLSSVLHRVLSRMASRLRRV